MPILSPTDIRGTVIWVGLVADRSSSLCSDPVAEVSVTWDGLAGECHSGLTRPSCSRVTAQYPKGTEIRNTRQVSLVSQEELSAIATAMGLGTLQPSWLGANLVISGIPDLTLIPPSSRLIFDGGVSLVVDMENGPCQFPAKVIDTHHPGFGARFRSAARNRRGLTGWVERPGVLRIGAEVRLHVPPQRPYPHL